MKKIARLLLTTALIVLAAFSCAYAQATVHIDSRALKAAKEAQWARFGEVITQFRQDIEIHSDSKITVKENITFNVQNVNITHGIVRTIPVTRTDSSGDTISVGLTLDKIAMDGARTEYKWTESDGNFILRIGSEKKVISPGLHTFTLVYTMTREIGFFDSHDELYWNVTGNEWDFPIMKASCSVTLPKHEMGRGFSAVEWYVGAYGQKGNKKAAKLTNGGIVVTTEPMAKKTGLTVVFAWPKGLVTPPPPPKQDDTTAHTAVGAAVFILTCAWFAFAWRKWGKDPIKTVVPIFDPPKGLSPAAVSYVRKLSVSSEAMSADIIDLAVKGALSIEEIEGKKTLLFKGSKRYVLHKKAGSGAGLTDEETALLNTIFEGDSDTFSVGQENAETLSGALGVVEIGCKQTVGKLFTRNNSQCLAGALIYAAGTAALYPWSGEEAYNLYITAIAGVFLTFIAMQKTREPRKFLSAAFYSLLRQTMPLLIIVIGCFTASSLGNSFVPFLLFGASALVMNIMRPLMMARNDHSAELLAQTEGLKLYMTTAEKGRLEMFNPPDKTPELFEKLLPYALVLGAAQTWADSFADVLRAADYKPEWYGGADSMFWNAYWLSGFTSGFGGQVASSSIPEVQETGGLGSGWTSGLGGGGFSGGGGGGGGGSGW